MSKTVSDTSSFRLSVFLFKATLVLLLTLLFCPPSSWGADPFPRENAIVKATRKVSSAVVNISTSKVVEGGVNPFFSWEHNELFDRFFRDFFEPHTRQYVQNSLGSGVIIDSTHKYVLTNHHVIVRASKISVTLSNQQEFEARVVGTDPESDLAVLKIETDIELPALPMGRSDDLMIGETVIAIGNPFGLSHSVTTGVISALNRSVRTEHHVYHNFIQIDAPINPGNSGGPLLNINGELIGINTAIYSGAEGIGFAIPIDRAKSIVDNLIHYGKVQTAWLGLTVQDLTENLITYFHLPVSYGALITEVVTGSPAEKGELKRGDVITELGKKKVASARDYYDQLAQHTANEAIELVFYRNGKSRSIEITAESFPSELALALVFDRLGFRVEELNRTLARRYGLQEGEALVIAGIKKGSQAERIGLKQGDIVRGINDVSITSEDDLKDAIIIIHKLLPPRIMTTHALKAPMAAHSTLTHSRLLLYPRSHDFQKILLQ
ncbi:MAG: trypsin-like peptidase domain-containing protein [Deltaproteobacteria bacterium]|nr:trypsin-like peptidase domain-containing protein [Deltaproteobacteria bacterium]